MEGLSGGGRRQRIPAVLANPLQDTTDRARGLIRKVERGDGELS